MEQLPAITCHRCRDAVRVFVVAGLLLASMAWSRASQADEAPELRTPQVTDALHPLEGESGSLKVHAVVALVPDPAETRQGRSFDMTLAAGIAGFQSHGYVLDGFELQWPKRALATEDSASPKPAPGGQRNYRNRPGLLVFRRDNWRSPPAASTGDRSSGTTIGVPATAPANAGATSSNPSKARASVEYFLVFLVGESPSYGVQPGAFDAAMQCAVRLDGLNAAPVYPALKDGRGSCLDLALPERLSPAEDGKPPLRTEIGLIGPSFSGSMHSVVSGLRRLCLTPAQCWNSDFVMVSPSASANSNARIEAEPLLGNDTAASDTTPRVIYRPLAVGLGTQFKALLQQPLLREQCRRFEEKYRDKPLPQDKEARQEAERERNKDRVRIAVLAEESTYGNEMLVTARAAADTDCIRISTSQFPPNIASIRTEQARLSRPQKSQARSLMPGASRLLEFNLDSSDEGIDRPPAYQPEVSSRSDELMLYRTFDAMRVYLEPDVVIIVATEIRDRLFVLSQVRTQLPSALPVLLELDYLTVHPDYRKTTRGAIIVPSADALACTRGGALEKCGQGTQYHLFPSDYAANAFRAVSVLVEAPDTGTTIAEQATRTNPLPADRPQIYVATLAGLQALDEAERGRFSFAAAETRLIAQTPAYITLLVLSAFALATGLWLVFGSNRGRWVFSLGRQLLYDTRFTRKRTTDSAIDPAEMAGMSLVPKGDHVWTALLIALSLLAVTVSLKGLWGVLTWVPTCTGDDCTDPMLAHGRDRLALACLWLLYGCAAVVGLVRVQILDRRLNLYIRHLSPHHLRPQFAAWTDARHAWIFVALLFAGVMTVQWRMNPRATSVDPTWPWAFAVVTLTLGVIFLVHLVRQHRLQRRLSIFLAATVDPVCAMRKLQKWPTYTATGEPPTTPFNLKLRRVLDLPPLTWLTPREWANQTRDLIDGKPEAGFDSDEEFMKWQSRLVAEMKLTATTIRTSAWCAMLAPVAVLLATTVYVPIYEGFTTGICIALLVLGFATTVYIVLRMEADPMFGPMFTRDGDQLTFGGGLRALWPKFVAIGLVLLPLVAPDMWRWLHGLLRSVNSIQ